MAAVMDGGSVARFLAQGVAGTDPQGWWDVLRHDVIPVAAAYVVFLGLLMTYRVTIRRPSSGAPPRRAGRAGADPGWGDLIRQLAGTTAGGYAFFLSIVVVFYFILGGEDLEFIRQALVEGSLLTFALVLPAFLVLTWIEDIRSRRRAGR